MIKINKNNALALFISTAFGFSSANAAEQPNANDLVGHVYGGIHALHIEFDDERLTTPDPRSNMDDGNGFGGEIGYRWLPSTEFRFSYSQFDVNRANKGFKEPDGASTQLDLLYFPTEQNFYVMTGVNNLDVEASQISGNLGAGYRHYFNSRAAVYIESKANYQFSERFDEWTSQVGFTYFFGDVGSGASKSANDDAAKVAAAKVIGDQDKDGVTDDKDQCPDTPMIDKVDQLGCTMFIDEPVRIELLVKFDNDKTDVKAEFLPQFKIIADFLIANPDVSLTIEGHCSAPGSSKYNKGLSQRRADKIVNMLSSDYNVSDSQLTAIGYGEERLVNLGNDEVAHADNRRIIALIEATERVPLKR